MRSTMLAAILALFTAGQALGEQEVAVNVLLGGDNNAAGILDGIPQTADAYDTTGAVEDNSTVINAGDLLNWAVEVTITGTNGDVSNGAANIVLDLELTQGGQPVDIGGSAGCASAGFCSTINNGSPNSPAGATSQLAAFAYTVNSGAIAPLVDDFDGQDNRPAIVGTIIDAVSDDGAGLDYETYPSANGYPAASTAPTGVLVGMGAGYSSFSVPTFNSFPNTINDGNLAGVGCVGAYQNTTCGATNNSLPVGSGPFFEGQLNTSGLNGTYELTVTAEVAGNNVLDGSFDPLAIGGSLTPIASFAEASTVMGTDTIEFTVIGIANPSLVSAVSRKDHSGTDFDIDLLNPVGTAGAGVESRGLPGAGIVERLVVGFDGPLGVAFGCGNVQINLGTDSCSSVTDLGGNEYEIALTGGTENSCIEVELIGLNLASPAIINALNIRGDANASGGVTVIDLSTIKADLGNPVTPALAALDINLSNGLTVIDLSEAKASIGGAAACP